MWMFAYLIALLVATSLGFYALGRYHERSAQREAQERLRRIDPGSRTPGLPTNHDSEPSAVRKARMWR